MSATQDFTLNLSIEDINTILKALGQQPFMEVYNIIHKIHTQVAEQS
jgi:hypothetical protein